MNNRFFKVFNKIMFSNKLEKMYQEIRGFIRINNVTLASFIKITKTREKNTCYLS